MFSALKTQRVSLQIAMPILAFLPFLSFLLVPDTRLTFVHNAQGFANSLFRTALTEMPLGLLFGSWAVVLIFGVILFFLNIRFEILGQRSVIISYMFFILVTTPLVTIYLHPGGVAALFLFIGLLFIFGIYHHDRPLPQILNSGIFFGVAVLIYPPYLLFFPVYWLAIARMKQPVGRDFLVSMMGFLIPVWLYGCYLFLSHQLAYEWTSFNQWFEIRSSWPPVLKGNSKLQFIWLLWLLFLLPMAFSAARSRKDAGRRVISVLNQFLWMGPLLILILERVSFEIWSLVSLPLAVLFSMAVMNARRMWMSNLLILTLMVFLVWFQIDRLL